MLVNCAPTPAEQPPRTPPFLAATKVANWDPFLLVAGPLPICPKRSRWRRARLLLIFFSARTDALERALFWIGLRAG
jgi:hypothetical protein